MRVRIRQIKEKIIGAVKREKLTPVVNTDGIFQKNNYLTGYIYYAEVDKLTLN